MITLGALAAAGPVPLPVLGEAPDRYSPSVVVVVTGLLTIAVVILFVSNSLASTGLAKLDINPLPRVLISAGVMIVTGVVFVLFAVHDQDAHQAQVDAHRHQRMEILDLTVTALERYYGVELDYFEVPIDLTQYDRPVTVEPGQEDARECRIKGVGGFYEIRCGSEEWDEATPLAPVSPAGQGTTHDRDR